MELYEILQSITDNVQVDYDLKFDYTPQETMEELDKGQIFTTKLYEELQRVRPVTDKGTDEFDQKALISFFDNIKFDEHFTLFTNDYSFVMFRGYLERTRIKKEEYSNFEEYVYYVYSFINEAFTLKTYYSEALENVQTNEYIEYEQLLDYKFVINHYKLTLIIRDEFVSVMKEVLRKGKEQRDLEEQIQSIQENGELPKRDIPERFNHPITTVDNSIWNNLNDKAIQQGQQSFFMGKRQGEEYSVIFSLSFEKLEEKGITLTRKLTNYDRKVFNCVCNILYNNGNKPNLIFTINDVSYMMNGNRNPSPNQREKIIKSIDKLRGTDVSIDNTTGYKGTKNYSGYLLPVEPLGQMRKGKQVQAYVKLINPVARYRVAPLFDFALDYSQIITIPLKDSQTPLSLTDRSMGLEEYLIWRINKNETELEERERKDGKKYKVQVKKKKRTILFSSVLENLGISQKKDGKRNPHYARDVKQVIEDTKTLLDYWKQNGTMFKDYKISEESITIIH